MRKNVFVLVAGLGLAGCAGLPDVQNVDRQNRVVDIVNTGAAPLEFYGMNAERPRLFRTRFAGQVLPGNDYTTVNFDDGSGACLFDLFAGADSGASAKAARFDTCKEVVWVVTPEMLQ